MQGEDYAPKWKEINIWEYKGRGNPKSIIDNIKAHNFQQKLFYMLIKKYTPLNRLTLCDSLLIYIVLVPGLDEFINQVLSKNSVISLTIWYDQAIFKSEEKRNYLTLLYQI